MVPAPPKRWPQRAAIWFWPARHPEKLQAIAQECTGLGAQVLTVCADVSKETDCDHLSQAAMERFGAIDILVNNAGIADKHRPIDRLDVDWYRQVLEINQNSVFYMMQAVLPHMKEAGKGSIVNISSIGAVRLQLRPGLYHRKDRRHWHEQERGPGVRRREHPGECGLPRPTPTALNTPEQIATFDSDFAALCNSHMALDGFPSAPFRIRQTPLRSSLRTIPPALPDRC